MTDHKTTDPSVLNLTKRVEEMLPDFAGVEPLPAMLMALSFDEDNTLMTTVLGAGGDPYKVLWDTLNEAMENGKQPTEAIALVCSGEMARIDTVEEEDESRQRIRLVALINDLGSAVTVRRADGEVLHFDDAGEGSMPELLRLWWSWWRVIPTN